MTSAIYLSVICWAGSGSMLADVDPTLIQFWTTARDTIVDGCRPLLGPSIAPSVSNERSKQPKRYQISLATPWISANLRYHFTNTIFECFV